MLMTPRFSYSSQDMPTISANSAGSPQARAYQPLLARAPPTSNTNMKDSRYNTSGTIQTKGTEATFCVMWLVTASSISEPKAESASQRRYSESLGALVSFSEGISVETG